MRPDLSKHRHLCFVCLFQIRGTTWSTRIRPDDFLDKEELRSNVKKEIDERVNIELDVNNECEASLIRGLHLLSF